MTDLFGETMELHRADSGHDLWAAMEAAQFARLVEHEPPRTDAEAACIADLLGFFSDSSEDWERQSSSEQAIVLEQLGTRVDSLKELGLFVHWAVTERRVDTPEGAATELPVAILTVTRHGDAAISARLPEDMDAE